jgi:hypothetical protein
MATRISTTSKLPPRSLPLAFFPIICLCISGCTLQSLPDSSHHGTLRLVNANRQWGAPYIGYAVDDKVAWPIPDKSEADYNLAPGQHKLFAILHFSSLSAQLSTTFAIEEGRKTTVQGIWDGSNLYVRTTAPE